MAHPECMLDPSCLEPLWLAFRKPCGQVSALSAMRFFRRGAKAALAAIALMAILETLRFDITAGLAALGIGGLALALGAQKTVENLVGSLTLIADRPVRIGDYCSFGDSSGTVEDIGMRSTRIRTLDRSIITVPNGQFSSLQLTNYAFRDKFLFSPVLKLRYETSADQIRYLLVELRALLYGHPLVDPASAPKQKMVSGLRRSEDRGVNSFRICSAKA